MTVADNGLVLEYRHDLYSCPSPSLPTCEISDVSVPAFAGPPWAAPDYSQLSDVVWRHDCDGGYLVGGYSNFSTNWGVVVTFQIEGGRDCDF